MKFSNASSLPLLGILIWTTISIAQSPGLSTLGTESAPDLQLTVVKQVVPMAVGKRVKIAQQLIRLSSLECATGVFYIAPQNWRNDIKPGVVYLQVPRAKELLRPGDTVACWRFEKADENRSIVKMPDLRGMSMQEAINAVEHTQLILAIKSVPTSTKPLQASLPEVAGVVTAQYPRAGQKIYEGTTVFFRIEIDARQTSY